MREEKPWYMTRPPTTADITQMICALTRSPKMNEFQTDTSHCPVPSDLHPLYSSISNLSLHEARSRSTVSSNSTLTLDSLLILQQNVRANKLLTELTLLKHSPDLFLISDPPKCIREGWCPQAFDASCLTATVGPATVVSLSKIT